MSQQLRFGLSIAWCVLSTATAQARVTPDEALHALTAGNRRFVKGEQLAQPLGEGARRTLASGQAPWAIVLTSADSRVVPEHIFNVGLGGLYVVRVAGQVADPAALASIEYAAEHLGASLCLVLGHHGSEFASLPNLGEESPGFARIAGRLRPAWQRAEAEGLEGDALLARAAEENTYETVAECLRRSAVLRELLRTEQFRLVPAMYALDTGEVSILPARPLHDIVKQRRDEALLRTKTNGLPPHVALSLLQAGHRRFLGGANGHLDLSAQRRQAVATAQRPFALVLTDADSRLSPEHLFDTGLGDLAVVRVAACMLDDEVLGSVEHAVREFGIGLVLVLAPDGCGVTELLLRTERPRLTPSMRTVADWLEPSILESRHRGLTGLDLQRGVVHGNVQRALREARDRSPLLRRLIDRGQLGMLGAVYRLVDGEIEWSRDQASTALAQTADYSAAAHATPHGETAHAHDESGGAAHGHEHDQASTHGHAAPAQSHGHAPATHDDHGAHEPPATPAVETKPRAHSPHPEKAGAPAPHHDAAHPASHGDGPAAGAASRGATDAHDHADSAPTPPAQAPAAPTKVLPILLLNFLVLITGALGAGIFLKVGQRRAARSLTAP